MVRFRTVLDLATFGTHLVLLLGPYRHLPWQHFLWVVVLVALVRIVRMQRAAHRQRRQDDAKSVPVALEDVVALVEGVRKTLALRGDVLNPALLAPLERVRGHGVEVGLFWNEPGLSALRRAGSPLPAELRMPEPRDREWWLVVDHVTVVDGPSLSGSHAPLGPAAGRVAAGLTYLLRTTEKR